MVFLTLQIIVKKSCSGILCSKQFYLNEHICRRSSCAMNICINLPFVCKILGICFRTKLRLEVMSLASAELEYCMALLSTPFRNIGFNISWGLGFVASWKEQHKISIILNSNELLSHILKTSFSDNGKTVTFSNSWSLTLCPNSPSSINRKLRNCANTFPIFNSPMNQSIKHLLTSPILQQVYLLLITYF